MNTPSVHVGYDDEDARYSRATQYGVRLPDSTVLWCEVDTQTATRTDLQRFTWMGNAYYPTATRAGGPQSWPAFIKAFQHQAEKIGAHFDPDELVVVQRAVIVVFEPTEEVRHGGE